ncbi:hypothetical protein O6H91_09G098800 [Diphasiastrum complanatum]|uniref:Uncharacterized protein n=1 Tax=Diphasiastrum complanatum TaxID=34168 RepID=A0ACC2CSS7_DIPCM|nr:hypothetical protein O6H91_09G098800 [Diphasiastrum complanatum]
MGSLGTEELVAVDADSQKETESNFKIESILFDLDDTLYPLSSGIAAACRKNIEEFMVEKLGIDKSLVPELCSQLYKTHGTTMAGLRVAGYQFSFDDFHNFAHGRLPYDILQPDRELQKILLNLPQRKYIFTNADRNHALKVLSRLGIKDCFDGIISFETIMEHPEFAPHTSSEGEHGNGVLEDVNSQVICKPSSEAMRRAINIAQVEPSRTLYCDDSARNIAAGKEAGFHTVLVGNTIKTEGADYAVDSIHEVTQILNFLNSYSVNE